MVYNQIKNMNEGTLTDKIKSNFSETGRILKAIAGAETKKIIEAGTLLTVEVKFWSAVTAGARPTPSIL